MDFSGWEQEVSHGLAEWRYWTIVGREMFVDFVEPTGNQMTLWRIMIIFNEGSCPCSVGS